MRKSINKVSMCVPQFFPFCASLYGISGDRIIDAAQQQLNQLFFSLAFKEEYSFIF